MPRGTNQHLQLLACQMERRPDVGTADFFGLRDQRFHVLVDRDGISVDRDGNISGEEIIPRTTINVLPLLDDVQVGLVDGGLGHVVAGLSERKSVFMSFGETQGTSPDQNRSVVLRGESHRSPESTKSPSGLQRDSTSQFTGLPNGRANWARRRAIGFGVGFGAEPAKTASMIENLYDMKLFGREVGRAISCAQNLSRITRGIFAPVTYCEAYARNSGDCRVNRQGTLDR